MSETLYFTGQVNDSLSFTGDGTASQIIATGVVAVAGPQGPAGPAGAPGATGPAGGVTSVAGKTGVVTLVESDVANLSSDLAAKQPNLTNASSQTSSFTATANMIYPVNAVSTAITVTLPTTNTTGQQIAIKKTDSSTNIVTISGTINGTASSNLPLRLIDQGKVFIGDGTGNWNIYAGDISLPTLDARYQVLSTAVTSVAGRTGAITLAESDITNLSTDLAAKEPSITIGTSAQYYRGDKTMQTLNQDAVPSGTTNKAYTATEQTKLAAITGTNTGDETTATIKSKLSITTLSGSNTGDQVIPTSLPPNGSASGDLSGSYPSPTVAKINGTSMAGLATGLLKNTTATGVPSIAAAGTDYVAPSGALGTPASGIATNLTGLPIATGLTGMTSGTFITATGTSTAASTKVAPAGTVAGTTDTQAFTNKDLTSGTNTFPTLNQNTTGSAAKLTTARTIAGVSFDGSANISLTSGSGIQKGNGSGGLTAATADTDYAAAAAISTVAAPTATPTITVGTARTTYVDYTGMTAAITGITLSGTPRRGDTLWITFTDNGTARALAFGTSFEASTVALPTTTVISTRLDVGFIWDVATSKFRCVAVA